MGDRKVSNSKVILRTLAMVAIDRPHKTEKLTNSNKSTII